VLRQERGFTLIELLIVILLIAVLAAISIPMFTGKKDLAEDSQAKSNARMLVSYVDSCFALTHDFTECQTQAQAEADDLDWGAAPGQVRVTQAEKNVYQVEAISRANNTFTIVRAIGGETERTCTGSAGCKDGVW
jgi:prepilin-type N-terminal cleavage/methylation domain-containing protein